MVTLDIFDVETFKQCLIDLPPVRHAFELIGFGKMKDPSPARLAYWVATGGGSDSDIVAVVLTVDGANYRVDYDEKYERGKHVATAALVTKAQKVDFPVEQPAKGKIDPKEMRCSPIPDAIRDNVIAALSRVLEDDSRKVSGGPAIELRIA